MATGRVPTTANSPLTAKGDLFGYSTTQARVAVGNNGETLVADSSTSTGLRWQGDYAAGKNKIINGDFAINQRNFTSTTTSVTYGFDRWTFIGADGTTTYSAQTFTPGTAPVAGYEGINFARLVTTGQTLSSAFSFFSQKIEDVRTLSNQTVTVSFWAKAGSGTPRIAIELDQQFGTGGSTRVATAVGQVTVSTSWARYSATIALPSMSGKTIGAANSLNTNIIVSAGSDFNSRTGSLGIQSNTFDIWGVQVEAGSVATAFQTATGTIQGELAACQRYFFKIGGEIANQVTLRQGGYFDGNYISFYCPYPVPMRTAPSITAYGNPQVYQSGTAYSGFTWNNTIGGNPTTQNQYIVATKTSHGLTVNLSMILWCATTSDYIGVSAEL